MHGGKGAGFAGMTGVATSDLTRVEPTSGAVPQIRTIRPVLWWAAAGTGFLGLALYLWISWIVSGEAKRVPVGVTPMSGWMKASLQAQQIVVAFGALLVVYFTVIRARRRSGAFSVDALFVMSLALLWWSDPLYNYFQIGFNYNAYFVNFGSWMAHMPGWQSPNPGANPVPVIWLPGVYICFFTLFVRIGGRVMRVARARWTRLGKVGQAGCCFIATFLIGGLLEALFMRMGSHTYASAPSGVTLFAGKYYQFPLYQAVSAAALYTSWACLREFRDDRGRSVAERGLDRIDVSPGAKTGLRYLAMFGVVNVIYMACYHIPMQFVALKSATWPADVTRRSYFTTGLCGESTTYACPGPTVPIPRGASWHVDPNGRLIVLPGQGGH